MDFITVKELRVNTGALWDRLKQGNDLVITLNGKPVGLLSGIRGENLEQVLGAVRQTRALCSMRNVQRKAVERGLDKMTMEEIDSEIRKVRQERRRASRS